MLGCRSVRPRSVRVSTTPAEAAVERLDRAAPRVVVFYKRALGRGSLADRQGLAFVSDVVDVEVRQWLSAGGACVLLEVGYAFFCQDVLAQVRVPRALTARPRDHRVGGVGIQLGLARAGHCLVPAEQVLNGSSRDHRPGPEGV